MSGGGSSQDITSRVYLNIFFTFICFQNVTKYMFFSTSFSKMERRTGFQCRLQFRKTRIRKHMCLPKRKKRKIEQTIFVFQTGKQNLKKQVLFPILETKLEKASFVSHFGNKT